MYIFLLVALTNFGRADSLDILRSTLKETEATAYNNPTDTTTAYLLFTLARSTRSHESARYWMQLEQLCKSHLASKQLPNSLRRDYQIKLTHVNNDLGVYYRDHGNMIKSLEYHYDNLKLYGELGIEEELGICYNNIALIYHDIGEKRKALEYFKKSVTMVEKTTDSVGHCYASLNLGANYMNLNIVDSALIFLTKALKLSRHLNEKTTEAIILGHLGVMYGVKLKRLDTALICLKQSLAIQENEPENDQIGMTLTNIGKVYFLLGKYALAKQYGNRSLEVSQKSGNVSRIEIASELLHNIYEKTGDYKKALEYYKMMVQMRDSTTNENTRKEILKKQMAYDFEKKELIYREKQEKLNHLFEQKQKFTLILSIVILFLVIILFFTLYFRFKFKKEKESKDLHIELKERLKQEIKEKETIANSILSIQEAEREKLAAELHDGVNQLLFASKIQLQATTSITDETFKDGVKLIDTAIQEIKSIVNNQASFLLHNKSLKDAFSDLVMQLKSNQKLQLRLIIHSLEEDTLDLNQKTMILRLVQELLNNVVRHSEATQCFVSVKITKESVRLLVSDNGKGISRDYISGNGLKNIKNKISLLKGIVRIFSIAGKGTKVYLKTTLTT